MNPNLLVGYISAVNENYRKNPVISYSSLNILEQFAWQRYLSAYQICSNLKSTHLKMAYKNVNKNVNFLLSSGLIRETEANDIDNKHNARYYVLTEYGIYQLFSNRLNSLLANQSEVRKYNEPSFNTLNFFRNYSDSILFKVFLYPYFKKDSLFAIGDYLLLSLYSYLSACCSNIEKYLKNSIVSRISVVDKIFSWNKVPGKDSQELILHLKKVFKVENIEQGDIKKGSPDEEYPTITVKTSSAPIIIRLDKSNNKVIMMSTADHGRYKELQYDVHMLGQELAVGNRIPSKESTKHIIDDAEKNIGQLIYGFVYDLALSAKNIELQKEISYYVKVLSEDNKFISTVQKIYSDRHKGFESGYRLLTAGRTA